MTRAAAVDAVVRKVAVRWWPVKQTFALNWFHDLWYFQQEQFIAEVQREWRARGGKT